MNQLEALKKMTTVVIDSGDVESILKYKSQDATTNPSLVLQAMSLKIYQTLLDEAISYARKIGGNHKKKVENAIYKIMVSLGINILENISGQVSIEVDARNSFDKEASIKQANKLINMFETKGVNRSRILIKLAATWEGIKAAEELEKNNIHCNLTLLFSFAQAKACAESNVYLISPFVGRIYDWYNKNTFINDYSCDTDPGVIAVRKIYYYYKEYNYSTIIMGASFRRKEQILALAGCDRLTISPVFLEELKSSTDFFERKLFCIKKSNKLPEKIRKSDFNWFHNQDAMAVDQLSDGIRRFGADQIKLEKIISSRL
ncbi:transaldolase [Buchnera aphidicola (Formosaphis micheliae)]|uniref:transaldolase n=1 Tax=Buchnera aphidicola TaxID=9 RepID=UPI0031B8918F